MEKLNEPGHKALEGFTARSRVTRNGETLYRAKEEGYNRVAIPGEVIDKIEGTSAVAN